MILAVDVGTSSLKAVVFARDGTPKAQRTIDYPTHATAAGLREQDPGDWWRALRSATASLDRSVNLTAIAFTGTMQNCIAMGPDGSPLGRAILYSDTGVSARARETCEARLPPDLAARIGNRPDGAMPVFRLMGKDHRLARGPDVHYLFGAKDVLIERLTGRAVIDPTTATTTGLFGLRRRDWDADLVEAAGLTADQLPTVLPADAVVGGLAEAAAADLGLPAGIPVINGAGDAGAAAWGAGAADPVSAHAYLGTTGWIAATVALADVVLPRDTYTLMGPVGEAVIAIAPLLQAGSALAWVARFGTADPQILGADDALDQSPPSALFLPYLAGERSPFQDRDVRAAFLGLDDRTDDKALRYAVLEGLCHAIRDNLEALGPVAGELPLIGGVAEDPTLRQLLADTLGLRVTVAPRSRLATAYGAFLFAAAALGFEAPGLAPEAHADPRPERRRRANRRFSAYRCAQRVARDIAADLLVMPDDGRATSPEDPS